MDGDALPTFVAPVCNQCLPPLPPNPDLSLRKSGSLPSDSTSPFTISGNPTLTFEDSGQASVTPSSSHSFIQSSLHPLTAARRHPFASHKTEPGLAPTPAPALSASILQGLGNHQAGAEFPNTRQVRNLLTGVIRPKNPRRSRRTALSHPHGAIFARFPQGKKRDWVAGRDS